MALAHSNQLCANSSKRHERVATIVVLWNVRDDNLRVNLVVLLIHDETVEGSVLGLAS